jgi:hypothetical protein
MCRVYGVLLVRCLCRPNIPRSHVLRERDFAPVPFLSLPRCSGNGVVARDGRLFSESSLNIDVFPKHFMAVIDRGCCYDHVQGMLR